MDNEPEPFEPDGDLDTAEKARAWLDSYLRQDQWIILANIMAELRQARYGAAEIVIADGRPQSFKITKSYR